MPNALIQLLPPKLQQIATAEPRKAGVLGALLLVLAFAAARALLSDDDSPSRAGAALTENVQENSAATHKLSESSVPSNAIASTHVLAWLDTPAAPLVRNPFYVRYEIFPPEVTKSESVGSGSGFWDEIAKSLTVQVDQEEKKHERLQALQQRASELQVASVMMGPSPRAMINDMLVGEGDVVANFRVLKIEARRIIVESEGIRLEIQMK